MLIRIGLLGGGDGSGWKGTGHEALPTGLASSASLPALLLLLQDELSCSGLPPCEGVVNLAGAHVLNPMRR